MSEPLEEQKPPESNCRDCVHRCKERVFKLTAHMHETNPELTKYFDGGPLRPECAILADDVERTVSDCATYRAVDPQFIMSTAAIGKWIALDILADDEIRFVLPANAGTDDEDVCRAWGTALQGCHTVDDRRIIWGAFTTKKVPPIPPSPIVKFPATASYIGEHVLRYVLRDGGKVLLERHESGTGTLYVCIDSASPGLLLLLRDTFAEMIKAAVEWSDISISEFCPQDTRFPPLWQPQIAVCVLSRTAGPVIYGALHGLPFPGKDSTNPAGERVDTTNRKIFTRELAESFPDPIAREIALASLAHQLAAKKGSE